MHVFTREGLNIGMLVLDPVELSDTDREERAVAIWELGFLEKYVVTNMLRLKSTVRSSAVHEDIKTYYVTRLEMRDFMDEKGIDWFKTNEEKLAFTLWLIDTKLKGNEVWYAD